MGKRSRLRASRGQEHTGNVSSGDIPKPVLRGAELIIAEASKKGRMEISLPAGSYRQRDQFDLHGHAVETGSIGSASPRMSDEQTRQLFSLAASLASKGRYDTQSFDPKRETFNPVSVETREHDVDGYLVYLPSRAARYSETGNSFSPHSFTTGVPILSPGEPSVSFVASDSSVRPADRAMSTATEIMQNRCIVEAVTFGKGKRFTDTAVVNAFQETFANGIGNLAGAVALGWTYEHYEDFLDMYEQTSRLWSGTTKGAFGRSSQFIAPHLMFGQETYDQLADGQIPVELDLIPRQPIHT